MKIGIVTFHRAHNYGAQLQAYALSTVLTRMGHDVCFIDYHQARIDKSYLLIDWSKYKNLGLITGVKTFIANAITFKRRKDRRLNFRRFSDKYLSLSPQYSEDKKWDGGKYDVIVFGSDQIWTKRFLREFDSILWGNMAIPAEKKISYAPSMEMSSLTETQKEFITKHLSNFDDISVREEQMKELLSPLTDKELTVVLDPVFLCQKEDYIQLAKQSRLRLPQRYILLYTIESPTQTTIDICTSLSKKIGLPVIRLCGLVELKPNPNLLDSAGPIDFLSAFANADFIVSTTFHGTAFSVVFEKDFYSIRQQGISGRAENLLNNIGLENRMISDSSEINLENLRITDYDKANQQLQSLRADSIKFLKDSLI